MAYQAPLLNSDQKQDTVLVIDDDMDIIHLMVSILASSDYRVLYANDTKQGIHLAQKENPDIILVDIMMPEMDGFNALTELKANEQTAQIPVIFTSPLGDLASKVSAFDKGGVDYIGMPFHPAEAIARIKTHITLQRAQNALQRKNGELSQEIATRRQAEANLAETNNQLQGRIQDLLFLNQVTEKVTRSGELDQVLDVVAGSLTELFAADSTSISIYNFETNERSVVSINAPYNDRVREFIGYSAPFDRDRINRELVDTGKTFTITDPHENDLFDKGFQMLMQERGISAVLVTPLLSRAEVIGSIHISTTEPERIFSAREVSLAETVAGQVAGILEIVRLLDEEHQQRQLVEKRNQELDAFAHSVAHDLKSPIGLAANVAEYICFYVKDNGLDELLEMAEMLERTCFKSANIVDELLLLSGVRKQDVQVSPIYMDKIVKESLERLNHMIVSYEGAQISVSDEWPIAQGYGPWIEEVWVNYISNAFKYGGRPPKVILGATTESDFIRFWVRDNGQGVPPESEEYLFTEFSRLGEVKKIEGHGLGLSIVRRIMDKLSGEVGYTTLPNGGSEFFFKLPIAENVNELVGEWWLDGFAG